MNFTLNIQIHGYGNMMASQLYMSKVNHDFTKFCLRYSLAELINQSPCYIHDKFYTQSSRFCKLLQNPGIYLITMVRYI